MGCATVLRLPSEDPALEDETVEAGGLDTALDAKTVKEDSGWDGGNSSSGDGGGSACNAVLPGKKEPGPSCPPTHAACASAETCCIASSWPNGYSCTLEGAGAGDREGGFDVEAGAVTCDKAFSRLRCEHRGHCTGVNVCCFTFSRTNECSYTGRSSRCASICAGTEIELCSATDSRCTKGMCRAAEVDLADLGKLPAGVCLP